MTTNLILVEGKLGGNGAWPRGNASYTIRAENGDLFGFDTASPLTDGHAPLLRGSTIRAELAPQIDTDGKPVTRDLPARRDASAGDTIRVSVLKRWRLMSAMPYADELQDDSL